MTKSKKLKMINELSKRLDSIKYQDHRGLLLLATDTRLVIRRVFGQDSVQMNEFEQIRVEPEGIIANRQHYLMTGAWNDGIMMWRELLRSMHEELKLFNEPEAANQDITITWLIKHVPWQVWVTLSGIITTTFFLGVKLGNIPWLKQLLGN